MDKIIFNDYDVTVEIYDSVMAKWVLTDYEVTDPNNPTYLRNRDKIQPKLVAGKNITIDPKTNQINADIPLDGLSQLISDLPQNELKTDPTGRLLVSFSGLLRDGGSVESRVDLPETSQEFIAYNIKDEGLIVFAYHDDTGLVWKPLSFYVDMSLYVTQKEFKEVLERTEHFRGYFATNAEIVALPNSAEGDYAYSAESGTKWIYTDKDGWVNSGVIVPDQTVPPSDELPLMDGVSVIGTSVKYARGDHQHPKDTSKVDKVVTTTGKTVVYAAQGNVQGSVEASDSVSVGTIACRTGRGTLSVADPTEDSDSANKKYVDGKFTATEAHEVDAQTFATVNSGLVGSLSVKAITNTQLLIQFTPLKELNQENTPIVVFSNLVASLIPSLGIRFGEVWDYDKVEQVGFCVINSQGEILVNALSTMFVGTQYTLLV